MTRALAGLLPGRKRRGASVGVFAFPSPRAVTPPSAVVDDVAWLAKAALLLCGVLLGSLLLSLFLTLRLIQTADVQPYVADGGIFGCRVPAIEEARP